MIYPHVGQTVLVQLTQADVNQIMSQRVFFAQLSGHAPLYEGADVVFGQRVPAIIVNTHVGGVNVANVRLLLDGTETPWLQGVAYERLFAPFPTVHENPEDTVDRIWPELSNMLRRKTSVRLDTSPATLDIQS